MASGSEIKVGDSIPSGITLFEFADGFKELKTEDLFSSGKVVLFGLPGAFTPGCSGKHLPSFVKRADEIKQKGYDRIVCVAVNDPIVMHVWGEQHKADGKIQMLGDPAHKLSDALGLTKNLGPALGDRMKRFSAVIDNGKITQLNIEPDGTGTSCSLAPELKL